MAEKPFRITPATDAPRTVLAAVAGAITNATLTPFREALDQALKGAMCCLILDVHRVPTISSMGLSYLAQVMERLEKRGGKVFLAGVDPKVKVVLAALGLDKFFVLATGVDAAAEQARAAVAALLAQPRLAIVSGPDEGAEFVLGPTPCVVGSDPDCTLCVQSPKIERRHAEFSAAGAAVRVRDLGSRTGTFAGTDRITDATLPYGAAVRIGELALELRGPAA